MPSVQKSIREIIIAQLSSSTCHGLPNIVTNDLLLIKLIWVVLWLAGVGTSAYLISLGFIDYYKFDVNSKTRVITENPTVLPKVTICNRDPFVTTSSIEFLANIIRSDNIIDTKNLDMISDLDLVNEVILENKPEVKFIALKAAYSHSDRDRFGYSSNEFFHYCKFNNITGCDKFYFEKFYHLQYGNCFTINSIGGADRNLVFKAGQYFGIELEIFFGKSPDFYSFTKSTGVVVFIYKSSTIFSDKDAIQVSAGTETSIALTKRYVKNLIYPYSPCKIDDDTIPTDQVLRFKNANLKYRQTDCIDLCYQEILLSTCGCIDLFVNIPPAFLKYNSLPEFCRSSNVTEKCLYYFADFDYLNDCYKKCPLECENEEFQYSISFADYPSKTGLRILQEDEWIKSHVPDADELKNNVLKLNIFFKELNFEQTIESQALTSISLFGYVGGILGLLLGLSLLSFGEALELIIKIILRINWCNKIEPVAKKNKP